jgi:ABC-type nitrate/sulfonate/bicarbonate transport system substrate-binding protein
MAMLRTGQTDGMTASISVELDAQEKGISRVIYNFGDLVHDFHNQVIFATDKLIAEKPEALRNFLHGWVDTVAFVQANKAATVSIIADALGMNEALVGSVYDILAQNYRAGGHFDPKALKTLSRSFVELNLLDKEPDMATLYTEAFLPK